jgi:hypothetical protein
MAETRFHLAGHVFVFRSDSHDPPLLDPVYRRFSAPPDAEPAAVYDIVAQSAVPAASPLSFALWTGPTWQILDESNGFYRINARLSDNSVICVARVKDDFSGGMIVPFDAQKGIMSEFATVYPTDRVVLTRRLAQLGTITLHASGVAMDGRALLFCGPAEIGKSTMASLWSARGATVMNDERMFIRTDERRIMASAAPWRGKGPLGSTAPCPPSAIFLLSQAPSHRLERLSPANAAARILANGVCPFCSATGMASLLDAGSLLTGSVPVYALAFRPTSDVVDFCLNEASSKANA